MSIKIWPGNMEVASDAGDLFGFEKLNLDSFKDAIEVYDLTEEEIEMAIEYFDEYNVETIESI